MLDLVAGIEARARWRRVAVWRQDRPSDEQDVPWLKTRHEELVERRDGQWSARKPSERDEEALEWPSVCIG